MKTIQITGWEEGFDKVGLNKLLRAEFGRTLGSAKKEVDEILDGQAITIVCRDDLLKRISIELSELRLVFRVEA